MRDLTPVSKGVRTGGKELRKQKIDLENVVWFKKSLAARESARVKAMPQELGDAKSKPAVSRVELADSC